MQGQRNSIEPFTDVFGFDNGSSSSNLDMDQQMYWNDMFLSSVESHNLHDYLVHRSNDTTNPYENEAQQDGPFVGFWGSGEASSSEHSVNFGTSNETKGEYLNAGGGLRIGERHLEHALCLENVGFNLNSSGDDICGQSSNMNNTPQNSEQYGSHSGANAEVAELRLHPYRPVVRDSESTSTFASLNAYENPLGNVASMPNDIDERPGSSLGGRRLACKRKNFEGIQGQSSANGSTSFSHQNDNIFHNFPSSSYNPAVSSNLPITANCLLPPCSAEEQLPCFEATTGMASGSYDTSNGVNNLGSAQRSFRVRTSTGQQISPHGIWPSSSIIRHLNSWNHQPHRHQNTFDEPPGFIPMVSSSNLQYHHPVAPGTPQSVRNFACHGASTSMAGGLSNSVSSDNRILGRTEEPNGMNVQPTNFSDSLPSMDMGHFVQEPTNWNADGRGIGFVGNMPSISRASPSSLVNSPAGSPWMAHQNLHRRYPRNLSEEIGRVSGALHGHQPPRLRSGFLLERQGDGVWGIPLVMRSWEGRRIMEIQNALEMMHRGENVRFESIFYGGVDMHDRHRDMRLDIDNMSYEELLALEERIGNVSTGLSEETVTRLLKQSKFLSWTVEPSRELQPCCICQEEYVDRQDLGTLDCGHDFHAGCIKQWLVVKNLCPICKTTGLKT